MQSFYTNWVFLRTLHKHFKDPLGIQIGFNGYEKVILFKMITNVSLCSTLRVLCSLENFVSLPLFV